MCRNGGTAPGSLTGSTCSHTGTYTATTTYSCPRGGTLGGSNCSRDDSYSVSVDYTCNAGDARSGSTCTHTNYVAASVSYSCPGGLHAERADLLYHDLRAGHDRLQLQWRGRLQWRRTPPGLRRSRFLL